MKFTSGTLISLVAVLFFVGMFLLSGLLFMLLTNVVITYYDGKALDYATSLASVALLWLFGGAISIFRNK